MPFYEKTERAGKVQHASAKFTIEEMLQILSPWVMLQCLLELRFKTRDAFEALSIFRERGIKKANAIGDCMGVRGFGLHRVDGVKIAADYGNATLVLQKYEDHDALAVLLGYESKDELYLAVTALGRGIVTDEECEELGYEDFNSLVAASKELPRPTLDIERLCDAHRSGGSGGNNGSDNGNVGNSEDGEDDEDGNVLADA